MTLIKGYRGNPKLKRVGEEIAFTQDQVEEYLKCKDDPFYFIENYCKIITLDKGLQQMTLFDYQRDIIQMILENRFFIRQASATVRQIDSVCRLLLLASDFQ